MTARIIPSHNFPAKMVFLDYFPLADIIPRMEFLTFGCNDLLKDVSCEGLLSNTPPGSSLSLQLPAPMVTDEC